jgi:hypothetical protein
MFNVYIFYVGLIENEWQFYIHITYSDLIGLKTNKVTCFLQLHILCTYMAYFVSITHTISCKYLCTVL